MSEKQKVGRYIDTWGNKRCFCRPCLDGTAMKVKYEDRSWTVMPNARFSKQYKKEIF